MINELINYFGIICLAIIYVDKLNFIQYKPFTCVLCMAFWLTLIYKIIFFTTILDCFIYPPIIAIFANIGYHLLIKLISKLKPNNSFNDTGNFNMAKTPRKKNKRVSIR